MNCTEQQQWGKQEEKGKRKKRTHKELVPQQSKHSIFD
jgi:hypothetical protein